MRRQDIGNLIECPNCWAKNDPHNNYCYKCNAQIMANTETQGKTQTTASEITTEENQATEHIHRIVYVEPPTTFAAGLPQWSIEPPPVAVLKRNT
jgi:hypothetical protein